MLLQDKKLIAKLRFGDLIAQDAMYHAKCLATLYKRENNVNANSEDQSISRNNKILLGVALAELSCYMISEGQDCKESRATVFKLANLVTHKDERDVLLAIDGIAQTLSIACRSHEVQISLFAITKSRDCSSSRFALSKTR